MGWSDRWMTLLENIILSMWVSMTLGLCTTHPCCIPSHKLSAQRKCNSRIVVTFISKQVQQPRCLWRKCTKNSSNWLANLWSSVCSLRRSNDGGEHYRHSARRAASLTRRGVWILCFWCVGLPSAESDSLTSPPFPLGGSTIVVLFEKGAVQWDEDLLLNGRACLETLVRVGMQIGRGHPNFSKNK